MMTSRNVRWLGYVVLGALVAALFALTPIHYEFYYSDAPRHALNGAFILDLVKAFPIHHPVQWAYNYYAQYPALTILFYPPLYPAILAVAYALFGISQVSAVIVNALFYAALLAGVYRLATRYVDRFSALAAAVLIGAAPEVAFWGRQIMTDVPATAASVWAMELLLSYRLSHRSRDLWLGAIIAVAAAWLKITVCFVLPVLAVGFVLIEGRDVWKSWRNWLVFASVILFMLPLIWLTLHFGQTNVQSVAGVPDGATSRLSPANWLWYARSMPSQLGWPLSAAVIVGLVTGGAQLIRTRRLPWHWAILVAWAVLGYLFFSTIDLKAPRFTIPVLPPLVLIGVWGVSRLFASRLSWARAILTLIAIATLVITVIYRPPLYVAGYATIVKDVARLAPKNSNVVFSGYRDGAFIFAMRAIGDRPDLHTLRADKLLLTVSIRRSTGVKQKNLTKTQIANELTRQKVSYVVAQDGFWTDLSEMKRLQSVLRSAQFRVVGHYRMRANFHAPDRSVTVYKNLSNLPPKRPAQSIDLPAINRTVTQS